MASFPPARLAAVLVYLLPAPLKGIPGRRGELEGHHLRQAGALSFLLLSIIVSTIPAFLLLSLALWVLGDDYSRWKLDEISMGLYLSFLGLWALLVGTGILLAAAGSRRRLPLAHRLGRRRWVGPTAAVGWTGLALVLVLIAGVTLHGLSLARPLGSRPAPIQLLFDTGSAPRWLMALGGYRMGLAARARWGPGSFLVAAFSPDSFARSVREARLLFVASHGVGGRIQFGEESLGPEEMTDTRPGERLQVVYLTACHGGDASEGWVSLLAPARVMTFPRNSLVLEHIAWLWFSAPAVIAALEDAPPAGPPEPVEG